MAISDENRAVSAGNMKQLFLNDDQAEIYLNGSKNIQCPCLSLAEGNFTGKIDGSGNVSFANQTINKIGISFPSNDITGMKLIQVPQGYEPSDNSFKIYVNIDTGSPSYPGVYPILTWDGDAFAVSGYQNSNRPSTSYSGYRNVRIQTTSPASYKSAFAITPATGDELMTIGQIKKFVK